MIILAAFAVGCDGSTRRATGGRARISRGAPSDGAVRDGPAAAMSDASATIGDGAANQGDVGHSQIGADTGVGIDAGAPIDTGVAPPPPDAGHAIDVGFAPDASPPDSGAATGLAAYCGTRYFDCGGSYYSTPARCVSASTNYWGTCPSRMALLDAFSDCMMDVPCSSYDPDAYNPASTVCAAEWSALQRSPSCP